MYIHIYLHISKDKDTGRLVQIFSDAWPPRAFRTDQYICAHIYVCIYISVYINQGNDAVRQLMRILLITRLLRAFCTHPYTYAYIYVCTYILKCICIYQDNDTVGRLVRIFRIARPLRAFRTFDGTKDVLKTFPRAVPEMGDVLALLLFVFVVYAILGINLFGLEGQFHGRCVVLDGYAEGTHGLLLKGIFDDVEPVCATDVTCPSGFGCSCKARLLPPHNTLERAPYAYADASTGDPGCTHQAAARPWLDSGEFNSAPQCPHYGYECFDNFGVALSTIFTKITLDSRTNSMWWAQDAAGDIVGLIFFLSLVAIIAFNIVNLNVAVISSAYQSVRDVRREINRRKQIRVNNARLLDSHDSRSSVAARAASALHDWCARGVARRTTRMPSLAMAARRLSLHPVAVDECGTRVPQQGN